jgi:7,8-dihydropterin-6-yl-methyl-4-(beta-D-ribofuranosyl)aminobenzene 5'-phosphate synthase
MHNLDVLDAKAATIDAVAISHGHYDHVGGLSALLEHLKPGTPLLANPDLFRERYSVRSGTSKTVGMDLAQETVAAATSLSLHAEAQEIVPGVWTTGEIRERLEPEGRSSHHRMRQGDELVPDRYLDDMALVLELAGRSALLCGCCHAGLLNTLACAEEIVEQPIGVIAGGLHLASAMEAELERVCRLLEGRPELERVYPNHCTGEAAFVALTSALGASVVRPFPAGSLLEL